MFARRISGSCSLCVTYEPVQFRRVGGSKRHVDEHAPATTATNFGDSKVNVVKQRIEASYGAAL
jgi:hypothetical protein